MVSDGEDQLEASSFSSLPTSQFVLRPFSSDMDVESLDGQSEEPVEMLRHDATPHPDSAGDRQAPVPVNTRNGKMDTHRNQSEVKF